VKLDLALERLHDTLEPVTYFHARWPVSELRRPFFLDIFEPYMEHLRTWNRTHDLTAARDDDELVDLLLADALVLSVMIAGERTVVDVGSGAGAPGLVLAIARPDLKLTLVEPRAKRVAFLRSAIGMLGLENAQVVRGRSESLPDKGHAVAISRATLAPHEWLTEGARLATDSVWVFLAGAEPPSHIALQRDKDLTYTWPLTGAVRRAVRYLPRKRG
jgi:16S rRNA (guanine527-N7)-methyltransferase